MLSELEKQIYNKHLIVSRKTRNKPFKVKKDFANVLNTPIPKFLKRLATLFNKHPEIDINVFFEAPYRLYPDVQYFDLEYFASMRAVKSYTLYKKQIFLQDPDSQLESVKASVRFIAQFCIEKKIHFHQYPFHRTTDMYSWIEHYRQNCINIYVMMEFPNVLGSVQQLANDLQKFFLSNFVENFYSLYENYNNSSQIKPFLKKSFPILSNFVSSQLTNSKNPISLN